MNQLYKALQAPNLDDLLRICKECRFAASGYFSLVSEVNEKSTRNKLSEFTPFEAVSYMTKERLSYRTSKEGRQGVYRLSEASIRLIASCTPVFYPDFQVYAQDLTFLRDCGSVWFHSVTHEGLYWFFLSELEMKSINYQFGARVPSALQLEDVAVLSKCFSRSLLQGPANSLD